MKGGKRQMVKAFLKMSHHWNQGHWTDVFLTELFISLILAVFL